METVAFLGGDRRMVYLAQKMERDGRTVCSWELPGAPNAVALKEAAAAQRIVLPVPLSKKPGMLNADKEISLSWLWTNLRPEQRIYAGAVRAEDRAAAAERALELRDYFDDEALAVRNAVPTAEGAVAAAMAHLNVTLHGTPCLVIGFGRIGKLLAHDLAALGAAVSVSARRLDDLAWIDAFGYTPLHTKRLAGQLAPFRAIFNTVPSPVLDEALLHEVRADCALIELASRDGIDAEAARSLGLDYVKASGLPGRAAPETAALALRDTLYRIWEEEP